MTSFRQPRDLGDAPSELRFYHTTRGVLVRHERSFCLIDGPGSWVTTVNQRGLFDYLFNKLRYAPVIPDYSEKRLLTEVLPPIAGDPRLGDQIVYMAGVTFPASREARILEFWRGVLGDSSLDLAGVKKLIGEDVFNRFETPYTVVNDPKNPGEVFISGTWHHASTTGGIAGFRGDYDLGDPKLTPSDVPENELVVGLTGTGEVQWFTMGWDMTARRIEQRSSLLLPRAKMHRNCAVICHECVCPNPRSGQISPLVMDIRIKRGGASGQLVWEGVANTAECGRTIPEIVDGVWDLDVTPAGGVVFGGTNAVPDSDFTLHQGDWVEMEDRAHGLKMWATAERVEIPSRTPDGEVLSWWPANVEKK